MKKWMVWVLFIVALLYGANMYAPQLAEEGLYRALSSRMTLHRSDIQVQAEPGLKILAGKMDIVHIQGQNVRFGDLKMASLKGDFYDVRFEPLNALMDGKVQVVQAGKGELTASINGDDVQHFMADKVKDLSDVQVSFADDVVQITGTLKLGSVFTFKAHVRGHFAVKDTKLMFLPDDIVVDGMDVQQYLTFGSIEVYDFTAFPLGVHPDAVSLQHDVLTIHASVGGQKALS